MNPSKCVFTEQEIEKIACNSNVKSVKKVTGNIQITYEDEFKERFRERIKEKRPSEIFKEAGLPADLIGAKRIEKAAARWR